MKKRDKALVGLLVATGVFSAAIAVKYVTGMTNAEMQALLPAAHVITNKVFVCDGSGPIVKYSDPKKVKTA